MDGKSPRGSAGSDTGASGGKHGREYAVCRDRSSGNGYAKHGSTGPGAERGQTESKEQGTEEDQKDGTQKDETQKDGMEITEPEQTETGITEPAAGESASTAEPEAPQSVPEETSKPAAHRVRFSTRRPTRFRRQFPLTFLLTSRRS